MTEIKPGDRVKSRHARPGTVVAVDEFVACVRTDGTGYLYTVRLDRLTLIPPKIAEPGIGEVVFDWYEPAGKALAWQYNPYTRKWTACFRGAFVGRTWPDFSDDVRLAVDPKAASHD